MEVHRKWQIAFGKSFFEVSYVRALRGSGEGNEIEIRVGTGGPFHARAIGPHGDTGKESAQEIVQRFALLCCEIYRIGHSHVVPDNVW